MPNSKISTVKKIANASYGFIFTALGAFSLTLAIYEIWKYIWAATDQDDTSQDVMTEVKTLMIIYSINFLASIAATFYMNQEKDSMEKHDVYSKLTKKRLAILTVTGLVPATIVAAGGAEFTNIIVPRALWPAGSRERAIAITVAAIASGVISMPGQMWSYANNLIDTNTFSLTVLREVFSHHNCTLKKKLGYSGLLFMQLISNILDNSPEVLSFNMLPFPAELKFIPLTVGIGITLGFSLFDLNNEISAVFGEILEKLNNTNISSAAINLDLEEQQSIATAEKPGWTATFIIKFLSGLNAFAYFVSSPNIMSLIDTPYTKQTHGDYYYLFNALKLAPLAIVFGSFSLYGQYMMVKPATQRAFGYGRNRYSFHARSNDKQNIYTERTPLVERHYDSETNGELGYGTPDTDTPRNT